MLYRKFANTDLFVSEIGFGAWAIGGGAMIGDTAIGWGEADDNASEEAIREALNQGINFFDTADIYGLGHSEELLGKIIGNDDKVIIASKGGNVGRDGKFTIDYSRSHILKACEESLKRLKRDQIDYYQLHSARIQQLEDGECIEAVQQLQQEGKIRYWGLSLNTFDPYPEAKWLMERGLGNGFQLVLNLLNQYALPLIAEAKEKSYGIIARMPLQFGLLTGKFDVSANFSINDHRKNRLIDPVIFSAQSALAPVWELCKKYQCTKTQLALSYILSYDAVSTVIPGIRTAEQAILNTQGLFKLSKEEVRDIERRGAGEFVEVMDLIRKQG